MGQEEKNIDHIPKSTGKSNLPFVTESHTEISQKRKHSNDNSNLLQRTQPRIGEENEAAEVAIEKSIEYLLAKIPLQEIT